MVSYKRTWTSSTSVIHSVAALVERRYWVFINDSLSNTKCTSGSLTEATTEVISQTRNTARSLSRNSWPTIRRDEFAYVTDKSPKAYVKPKERNIAATSSRLFKNVFPAIFDQWVSTGTLTCCSYLLGVPGVYFQGISIFIFRRGGGV